MSYDLRNIKLTIAYDGTDFSGWQSQKNQRTVQETIETALAKLHKKPVPITGAGRTDSGVHAEGQAAHFHTDIKNMEAWRFIPALNGLMSQDVRILNAEEVDGDFHARFDAKARTYRYRLICGRRALPQELRYNLQVWRQPSIGRLNEYARFFRGEMDCTMFAAQGDPSESKHRYLFGAYFFIQGGVMIFEITANAFLWKMVRSIVGTLLHYEEKGISPEDFRHIIEGNDRLLAGPTASPVGLSLWKVSY